MTATGYRSGLSGISSVGAYQLSGVPYATSSLEVPALGNAPVAVEFPYVSKFVTVRNTLPSGSNVDLRVGFSAVGVSGTVQNNYFTLGDQESYTGDWRIATIYLLADSAVACSASVVAGLAPVAAKDLTDSSIYGRSNWSGSVGVG